MVDEEDSKSFGGNIVWVRVPPPAPNQYNPNQIFFVGDGFGLFLFFPCRFLADKAGKHKPCLPACVRPAFQMAVEDDLLRKNPFEFQLCTVVVNDSVTRQAITKEQEELFLEFIRNDDHYSKYYNGMFILFKTGLRISEFCGLTVKDIDLQERKINVNHQLQRTRGMQYVIEDTKTQVEHECCR